MSRYYPMNSKIATLAVAASICFSHPAVGGDAVVRVISSRADSVSGGDALVEARVPTKSNWAAYLNGHDVTTAFRPADGSGMLIAHLTGLELGRNLLR